MGEAVLALGYVAIYALGALGWYADDAPLGIVVIPFSPFVFPWYAAWAMFCAVMEPPSQRQRRRQRRQRRQRQPQQPTISEQILKFAKNEVVRYLLRKVGRQNIKQYDVQRVRRFLGADSLDERRNMLRHMPLELAQDAIRVNQALPINRGPQRIPPDHYEYDDPYKPQGIDLDPTGLGNNAEPYDSENTARGLFAWIRN